jgi:hypothetical protein
MALAGMLMGMGCAGGAESTPESTGASTPAERGSQALRAPDGSLRRPFLGGAFVTWNRAMPIEIDQAIAGETPDHAVLVWAGP